MKKIEYGDITVKKCAKSVFEASAVITKPLKSEVTMKGRAEDIARQKLELFLQNKPYKHLD